MRATDGTGQVGHTMPVHCFVTTSSGRFPGILLEWLRDGPWKGRVIWSERPGSHRQDVLDAKQLEPFEPPSGFSPRL